MSALEKIPCLSPTQVVMRSLPLANASSCFLVTEKRQRRITRALSHNKFVNMHRTLSAWLIAQIKHNFEISCQLTPMEKKKKTFLHDPNLSSRGHCKFNKRSMCVFMWTNQKNRPLFCILLNYKAEYSSPCFYFCSRCVLQMLSRSLEWDSAFPMKEDNMPNIHLAL